MFSLFKINVTLSIALYANLHVTSTALPLLCFVIL